MKIIKNQNGYTTSILVLILLLPLIMLMIIIVEEYSHNIDNTIETIESEKIRSKTEDFENEIITITKKSLHEVSFNVTTSNEALKDSRTYLKEYIETKINKKEEQYKKENINIDTTIDSIDSSDNPFKIQITYHITTTANNSNIKITKQENKLVEITDNYYPVYDPLPILKTQATFSDNKAHYHQKLSQHIKLENNEAYLNAVTLLTIRKCPYEDYTQHGNNNQTITNCIINHYYHNSHDGLCILCRLENKTSCSHYGFETFILPTHEYDKAPASIDHVLLNDENNQYSGNKIIINNQTLLYLDNGHKTKYGL